MRCVKLVAMTLTLALAIVLNVTPAIAQNNLPAPAPELPAPVAGLPLPSTSLPNPALNNVYIPAQVVIIPPYARLNHRVRLAMEIFGGSPSYGILDLMWPMASNLRAMLYSGVRGLVATSNNGLTERATKNVTFELGYRQMMHDAYILGGYMMLDRQLTGLDHYFTQLNPGFEYLSTTWDVRANGYLPIGKTRNFLGIGFGLPGGMPALSGHNITLENFLNNEIAQAGLDIEVGRALPGVPRLRGYAGYAHYFARGGGSVLNGARLRIDYLFGDHTELELRDAYDHIFGNRLYIGVRFVLGGNTGLVDPTGLEWKMTSFPIRARGVEAIPQALAQGARVVNQHVFYVNSNAAAGGDGTFERPFTTMAGALAAATPFSDAIIYVYQGSGTYTMGAASFTGNQILTGQGGNWFFDGVSLLPGSAALRPELDGTITTNGNNLLENVGLSNPGAPGTGTGITVAAASNTLIRNMRVGAAGSEFISGVGVFGTANIVNSQTFTTGAFGIAGGVTANAGSTVFITNTNLNAAATGGAIPFGVVAFGGSNITMTNGAINSSTAGTASAFGAVNVGGTITINNVLINATSTTGSATGVFGFGAGTINLNNDIINATTGGASLALTVNATGAGSIINATGTTIRATGGAASLAVITSGGAVFNNNDGNVCVVNGVVVACP